MPLVQAKCTNCGASLLVDDAKEAAICQYCGAAYIVEQAISKFGTMKDPVALHSLGDEAVADGDYQVAERYYTEIYTQNSRDLRANAKRVLVHSIRVLYDYSPNGLFQDGVKYYSNAVHTVLQYLQSTNNASNNDLLLLLQLLHRLYLMANSGYRMFSINYRDDLQKSFFTVFAFIATVKAHVEILNCCIEQNIVTASGKDELIKKAFFMIHRIIDGRRDELVASVGAENWNKICKLEDFFAKQLPPEELQRAQAISKKTIPTDSSVKALADNSAAKPATKYKGWKILVLLLFFVNIVLNLIIADYLMAGIWMILSFFVVGNLIINRKG